MAIYQVHLSEIGGADSPFTPLSDSDVMMLLQGFLLLLQAKSSSEKPYRSPISNIMHSS